MPSVRIVAQPDGDVNDPEEKAEPAAATHAITGLEDPAISEDALARAEASRRAYEVRKERRSPRSLLGLALSRGTMGTRRKTAKARTSMFVQEDGGSFLSLDDWLARPRVMRALQKPELALSEVENGKGSIEDVNMYYPLLASNFDLIERFVKAGGQ